ncbi:MAG: hypothetical protein IJ901_04455 [Bacteroidaceae bacterium]|nr:hypothetical protein [Bacteroidaceae bacterium]
MFHCIDISVAKFSDCRGTALLLPWHCIAAAVGELCDGNGRTMRRQSENFATATAMQCYFYFS